MKRENAKEYFDVFGIDLNVAKIEKESREEIEEIKDHLKCLQVKAESMYDNTTDKISEVYEKNVRYWNLGFGILLAFIVNADLFGIYNTLSRSPAMRQGIIEQSDNIESRMRVLSEKISNNTEANREINTNDINDLKNEFNEANDTVTTLLGEIESAGLVLGWTDEKYLKACKSPGSIIYKLIGLLIAGLLISFGAPFWHDFIGTFTGLRKILRGNKKENVGERAIESSDILESRTGVSERAEKTFYKAIVDKNMIRVPSSGDIYFTLNKPKFKDLTSKKLVLEVEIIRSPDSAVTNSVDITSKSDLERKFENMINHTSINGIVLDKVVIIGTDTYGLR